MTHLSGANLNNRNATAPQSEGRDKPSTFPKYPAYKDSGVEWLEEVPERWTVSKLGYFFREPPCYGVLVPDFDPDGVPMLRITDMEHEFIDASGLVTISPSLSAQYARTIVQVGDIVLSLVGTIGKAFEISPKLAGVNLSRAVARIQLGSNTLPRYLCWIFQSREFTHFIDLVCKGTAQRVLNLSDLNAFSFTFPSYSEQCAISRFLDHETARIDALIEEQQRLIELLKEKRQAVISHAVTKGLDPTVPMKDSGVEWLGEVPAHWEVCKLSFRYSVDLGKMLDGKGNIGRHPVPYLRNQDVQWGSINTVNLPEMDITTNELARYSVRFGDLLVCEGGDVGRSAMWWGESGVVGYQKALHRLRPWTGRRDTSEFFFFSMVAAKALGVFEVDDAKATISHLPAERFRQCIFAFPPFIEQQAIAETLNDLMDRSDKSIASAKELIDLLQERRSALISAAVTGKIDVRGWQPPEAGSVSSERAQQSCSEAI